MSFDFDEAGTAVPARTGFDFDEDGNAVSDTPKSKGLIDRIKGALSSNEAVAGGGMSAEMDTGANAPEIDPNKISMPGSVMDGFTPKQSDEGMSIEAGMGPMRKDFYDKTRGGLMAAPIDVHAQVAQGGGQAGKVAAATLPARADRMKRDLEGTGQARTVEDLQDDLTQRPAAAGSISDPDADLSEFGKKVKFVFTSAGDSSNPMVRGAAQGVAGMGQAAAGLGEMFADQTGNTGMAQDARNMRDHFKSFENEAAGKSLAKQAVDITQAKNSMQRWIDQGVQGASASIVRQLPGMLTGRSGAVLTEMFFDSLGQEYGDARAAGKQKEESLARASVFATFEVLGEKLGLDYAMPKYRQMARGVSTDKLPEFFSGLIKREVPGELFTHAGQSATDAMKGIGMRPDMTFEQYLSEIPGVIRDTVIQTGMMSGGGAVMNAGVRMGTDAAGRRNDLGYDAGYSPATIDAAARGSLDPENAQAYERIRRPAPMPAPAMLSPEAIAAKVSAAGSVDEAIASAASVTETPIAQQAAGLISADQDLLSRIKSRATTQGALNGNQAAEAQPVEESQQEAPADAEAGIAPPVSSDLDKQNRDRTRDASILQMQQIANKPDYELASIARDSNGAPMVEDNAAVPKENIGKAERVTLPDGTKIDTHYAVVEADTLSASHTVDGQANAGYGSDGKLTALNNGRTAGLQAAYTRGTAAPYRAALEADTAGHGVPAEVITGMKSPVLVRVYDKTTVDTANLAARSNQSSALGMSSSEQAGTDAKQITHMGDLAPTDNGDFSNSHDFINRFVKSLPITEQAGMMDKDGGLSQTGYARVRNAVLAKAYGDSPVLQRMVESMDDNMRNITKALVRVAPDVAKMRAAIADGSLHKSDITPHLIEAVEELSRLKDAGKTVAGELAQSGMFGDKFSPETREILTYLDANIRRPKQIGDFIKSYAEKLIAAGNPNQGSLLGESTAPAKADLIAAAKAETDKAIAKAKSDLNDGIGELGDWLRQNNPGVFHLTAEEEKHIFPILVKIADAAIRLVGNNITAIMRAVKAAMTTHPDKTVKGKRKEIEKHPIFQKAILQAIKDYKPTTSAAPIVKQESDKAPAKDPQSDLFSAPAPAAKVERSGPITIDDIPPARLSKIKVSVDGLVGDQVTAQDVSAKQALADVDEEISAFELLLKCLKG